MPHKNKAQRAANATYNQVMFGSLGVSQILFVQRIIRTWSQMSSTLLVIYLVVTLVGVWCARSIANTRDTARVLDIQEGNIGISYHLDVLILSVVATSGAGVFSDYFFLLFLCIPAYLVYKGLKSLITWVFTPTESEMEENFLMQQKKLQRASTSSKSRVRRSNKFSQRTR